MGNYNYLTVNIHQTNMQEVCNCLSQITSRPCFFDKDTESIFCFPFHHIGCKQEENGDIVLRDSVKWESYENGHKNSLSFWGIEELARKMGNAHIQILSEPGCKPKEGSMEDGSNFVYDEDIPASVGDRTQIDIKTLSKQDKALLVWGKIASRCNENAEEKSVLSNSYNGELKRCHYLACSNNPTDRLKFANIVSFVVRAKKDKDFTVQDYKDYTRTTDESSAFFGGFPTISQEVYRVGILDFIKEKQPEFPNLLLNDTEIVMEKMAEVLNGIAFQKDRKCIEVRSHGEEKAYVYDVNIGCCEKNPYLFPKNLYNEDVRIFIKNGKINIEDLASQLRNVKQPRLLARICGFYKDKITGEYKQSTKFNQGLSDPIFGTEVNDFVITFAKENIERVDNEFSQWKEAILKKFEIAHSDIKISVPFSEKDVVKKAGAKWDTTEKTWTYKPVFVKNNSENFATLLKYTDKETIKKLADAIPNIPNEFKHMNEEAEESLER